MTDPAAVERAVLAEVAMLDGVTVEQLAARLTLPVSVVQDALCGGFTLYQVKQGQYHLAAIWLVEHAVAS